MSSSTGSSEGQGAEADGGRSVSALVDPSSGALLGRVVRVDPGSAVVGLADSRLLTRVTVSDLVCIRGSTPTEFLVGLVETATGASGDELDGGTGGPGAVIRVALIGTLLQDEGTGQALFKRGTDAFPRVGDDCHLLEGEQLKRFMSVLGENVAPDERLALGRFAADPDAMAIADGNRLFQRHLALLGSTGAGKSWAVALMLERAARLAHSNLIVFDMHGEYAPLAHGAEGKPPIARPLRIAGPSDLAAPADDVIFVPYWLLDRDEMLSLILDPSDPDAPTQAIRFTDQVHKLKESALLQEGREETAATMTVDSPVPYDLEHLISWLQADDTEKIQNKTTGAMEPGPFFGRLTRFISRLEARMTDRRYGFMFSPPPECLQYDWLSRMAASLLATGPDSPGIKVVDFSEVPAEALPVVAGVVAHVLYDIQFWMDPAERTPISLVCDEAHLYLPVREETDGVHEVALRTFEQIAKEGRKYGVGLVVVSQRPADVSRTVVSQCNNFVVMRLTNDHDQHVVRRLVSESMTRLTDVLPLLDVGEAIVLGDALLLPTRLKFDPPAIKPASGTRAFWTDWTSRPSSAPGIAAGVEALRRQVRPDGWADKAAPPAGALRAVGARRRPVDG